MALQKLVYGVGINDANYKVTIVEELEPVNGKRRQREVWRCPFYSAWKNILTRCYSQVEQNRRPSYIGCTVCEEWLSFMNFKAWMETQDWENKSLDKDLLFDDNKIYSPETCVFIDKGLNSFLAKPKKSTTMVGTTLYKKYGTYISRIFHNGEQLSLGVYSTQLEAHRKWQEKKIEIFDEYIEIYKNDEKIKKALNRKRHAIYNDYINEKQTIFGE